MPVAHPTLTLNDDSVVEQIATLLRQEFPTHPFEEPLAAERFTSLLAEYLGMSVAFPYLQAGAQQATIMEHVIQDTDVSLDEEITLAVGAFLVADETGVNATLLTEGLPGLPGVLDTRVRFHSALLRKDIGHILGHEVRATYSPPTQTYLLRLAAGLASPDAVQRVAMMVSFEAHAERMITGLWDRISEQFDVRKDDLVYFSTHVGGDDPAEAYHVAMTSNMINRTVTDGDVGAFEHALVSDYRLHLDWCSAIAGK